MKQKLTYLCALAALLTATACTHDDAPGGTAEGTASASFHITTRADGTTGIGQGQHAWLYLAERLPELLNGEQLYCDQCYDVSNGSYLIEGLTAQWYKLAFICLPQGVKAPKPADNNHEFNDYVIDYSPVLITQDALNPDKDLAIYRQIIDRWLLPDEKLTENVTLTRITGQLILDMGILKDQFPGRVSQITVNLSKVPQKVYLRDNGNGEILYPTDAIMTQSISYPFDISPETWEGNDHFRVYLDLLPFELKNATVTVKHLAPKEGEAEMQEVELPFPLVSGHHSGIGEKETISVKPNTRTTVYFRGMEPEEFEVRYAGFDNQSIDVDGGEWNGWN